MEIDADMGLDQLPGQTGDARPTDSHEGWAELPDQEFGTVQVQRQALPVTGQPAGGVLTGVGDEVDAQIGFDGELPRPWPGTAGTRLRSLPGEPRWLRRHEVPLWEAFLIAPGLF